MINGVISYKCQLSSISYDSLTEMKIRRFEKCICLSYDTVILTRSCFLFVNC